MNDRQNSILGELKHSKDSTTHKTSSKQSSTQTTNVNVPIRPKESKIELRR